MNKLSNKKIIIFVGIAICGGVFLHTLYSALFYAPSDEVSLPQEAQLNTASATVASAGLRPTLLKIPKINVVAKVTEVGITAKGNMATPTNFTDVGWYKYGTLPGMTGSAVIAGHVNNGLAFPAVFSNLKNLTIGDDIYLTSADNATLHFVVTKTKVYDFNATTEEVFGDNSDKLLKLITCTGVWLTQYKTHNERLVVTAILID